MSQLENLLSNESKENIFLVRAVSIVGGIVYFSWSFIYRYAVPGAIDPVETRLIISGLCLVIFLATFIRQARRYITHITYTAMFLTTAQLLWITYQNNFNPYYQMGTIILICVTVAFYQSLKSLLLYIIATSALLFIPFFYFDLNILLFLYFGCGTVFLVSAAALFTRLVLANKLQKSRLEIAQTAEKIEAINRDVKSIMQNIQQGIFTIESPDGHTGKESSDYITRIFDMEPEGDFNFIRFFAQSDLTKDHLSQIKSAVASIGDDFLQFELNSHVLPASFTLKASNGERKIIEIDWNPIVKEDNVLQKILVTVRDVTEYRKLVAANEARQEELKHISEIIAINDKKMGSLFESISRLMSSAKGAAQHCGEILDSSSMSKLFRDVHTIKGLARTYDLSSLAECAHHCEDRISELKKRGAFHRNEVIEILRPIEETLGKYADVTVNKLKRSRHNNNQLVMDRRQIMAIVQETRNSATWSADAKTVYLQKLQALFISLLQNPLATILEDLLESLPGMASQLQKAQPIVQIDDPSISFSPSYHDLLKTVFTHLLRNSVDHGIEAPGERLLQGKPTQGRISIKLTLEGSKLFVFYRDDGRGLDLQRIKEKAMMMGLCRKDEEMSSSALANMIFHPDLSTKAQVSAVSGRGIGMDAVKSYLMSFGCRIDLELLDVDDQYAKFQFKFSLPTESYESFESLLP